MTRPKRAALKRRLTELYVRKLKPKSETYSFGTPYSAASRSGCSPPVRGPGNASTATTAARAGCTWATLAPSGWPTRARWRRRRCWRSPAGKTPRREKRAERGAGTFAELAERYVEGYAKTAE